MKVGYWRICREKTIKTNYYNRKRFRPVPFLILFLSATSPWLLIASAIRKVKRRRVIFSLSSVFCHLYFMCVSSFFPLIPHSTFRIPNSKPSVLCSPSSVFCHLVILVPQIFTNQLHMNAVLNHVAFNDAPHVADSLGGFAIAAQTGFHTGIF